jgi:hypothetical protein
MVSVIEEKREREGRRLQQLQHHYNDYHQLESSAYSLFVLAIRSPQTKQKYHQRFGYFLDFAQVATEKGTSIEERCNMLAEVAKNDYKWLLNCIFNYLQLLKTRVESKEIKPSTLRVTLFPDQNKVSLIGLVNLLSHKKKNNLNKTHNSKTASLTTIQKCFKFG